MEKKIYKTETHLHCAETSSCSHVDAAEFVRRYKEIGYSTVFVSDHYSRKRFRNCETEEDFIAAINEQLKGYYAAKAEGDRIGVTVLMSCEIHIESNDYLFYGIDESFFRHKELCTMNPEELFAFANEMGYTVIAAHPFRGERTPVPSAVHGLEIVNASHNHYAKNHNDKALALAETLPNHLRTSGSDAHFLADIGRGGIITEEPINSAADYVRILRSGKYETMDNPSTFLSDMRQ